MAAMSNANATDTRVHFVIAWVSGRLNRIVKCLLRPASTSILIGSMAAWLICHGVRLI